MTNEKSTNMPPIKSQISAAPRRTGRKVSCSTIPRQSWSRRGSLLVVLPCMIWLRLDIFGKVPKTIQIQPEFGSRRMFGIRNGKIRTGEDWELTSCQGFSWKRFCFRNLIYYKTCFVTFLISSLNLQTTTNINPTN